MTNHEDVVIIGITGGIGSGKSTIAKWVREKGYSVLSSDDIAKQEMSSNEELKNKLIAEFGNSIYLDSGELNKSFLSDLIFDTNHSQVKKINQIVHPYAIESIMNQLEELANSGSKRIFVESALMYESGMAEGYDYVITVHTDEEKVIERVQERSSLSEEKIRTIMKSQLNPIEKKKLADFVIDNNGTVDDLRVSFDTLFPILEILPPNDSDDEE
ncbi:MAG: dephospho-CoA kinase [Ignavibacteriae bacterium HGW-Ignavibacteriae-4]|jgi:dephospho-CoA kinase|nr:MAG: dephospho-CoA kinase [Ignavibacteriae bacterium HGW-Ignavibacteriae-4]